MPAIVDWYAQRSEIPWLAVPDRLLHLPAGVPSHVETVVMVRDLPAGASDATVTLAPRPDATWLRIYERDVPVDVLTAVVDGEVVFATRGDAAVGRAAVTSAPDGTRWAGLSAVRVADGAPATRPRARTVFGPVGVGRRARRATHCYVQVLADNTAAIALYESLGFSPQHRSRYVDARSL